MGTTFSSVHVFSHDSIQTDIYEFRSFSDGWQTCVSDFSDKDPEYPSKVAKLISTRTAAPVLYFHIFDSDFICFKFFQNGKNVAKYLEYEFSDSKNLYSIPTLLAYGDGYKKRLSNILSCGDAHEKTQLLEEYFGVCLLPFPELVSDPSMLSREKGDALYTEYMKAIKAMSGTKAPISLQLVKEYKGKLFVDHFGQIPPRGKKNCFFFGYENEESANLTPVRFLGESLEPISAEEFEQSESISLGSFTTDFCDMEYGLDCYAIFNDLAPAPYAGKRMKLPRNFFPLGFDSKGRLVLVTNGKIAITDNDMKIIAYCSVKGDVIDMVGDYILTATGSSFYFYGYDPKASVKIYQLIEK